MGLHILMACGGTAGHINPAIAIADELKKRHPDAEILFIGTENHREAELVPRAGYDMKYIKASGFSRKKNMSAVKHNVESVATFIRSEAQVRRIIKEFKPDIAIGSGGFVSAPVIFAAHKEKVLTAIHEQNAFAGVTTKMLAPRADKIFLSFPLANPIEGTEHKQILVGNPVNSAFLNVSKEEARATLGIKDDDFVVLSCGGSLGAVTVNDAWCEMAQIEAEENKMILHHGASRDFASVSEKLKETAEKSGKIHIYDYIYNMPQLMAACDVIVTRSGAMTLAEIAALGKPSVLIPSPNVAENHQYFNAKTYSDAGAAVLIEEKDLTGRKLYDTLNMFYCDRRKLHEFGKNALKLAKTDSAERIADGIEELLNK